MPTPSIRLGYHGSPSIATRILHQAGRTESDARPSQYDIADPFRALLEDQLDVMIVKFGVDEPALRCSKTLGYEPRAAVVRAQHPLAARDSISIEEVAAYSVFDRPGVFPASIWDEVVPPRTASGRELRRRHRVATVPEMMALIASSDAVHVSLASLAEIAPPSIRIVPIHDLPPAPVALAWRRGIELPAHVQSFIEAAQQGALDGPALRVPVALLHALPLHASMWDVQQRELAWLGVPVIAFDQRGFGRNPLGEGAPSLDTVADELARAADARGLDRLVLVGASMGGYVTMAFLRRHRDRVAGLALMASRAMRDSAATVEQRERFAAAVLSERSRGSLIAETTPSLLGAATRRVRPDLLARLLDDASAADPRAVAWAQRAIAAREDALDALRATRVPAVVIAGEDDELMQLDEARLVASSLPEGRLITIPGAGHLPSLEAPERVTAVLVELLREVNRAEQTRGHA